MTGLEKILAEISGEAQAAREAALAQAQKEAQAILDEAARRTDTECERIAEKGAKAARQALERAEAGAELQRRRVLLEERQALILNAMETAGKTFLAMPDEEYFDVLEKTIFTGFQQWVRSRQCCDGKNMGRARWAHKVQGVRR